MTCASRGLPPLPPDPIDRDPCSILLIQANEGELLKQLVTRWGWVRTGPREMFRWRR